MLKIAIKYGVIMCLFQILAIVLMYVIGPENMGFFGSTLISLGTVILVIWLGVKAVKDWRKSNENVITFKESFHISMTAFLIMVIISGLFQFILFQVIDPDYSTRTKVAMTEKVTGMLEKSGLDDEQIEEQLAKMEETDFGFGGTKALKYLGISVGIFLAISLIISAAIKKDLNEVPNL